VSRYLPALWGMSRPLQLLSVVLVYGLGGLVAHANSYDIALDHLLTGAIVLLPVAASIHYANEYADYETDSLTQRTPFSGGSGVLPRGHIPRRLALSAAFVSLVIGLVLAAALLSGVALRLLLVGAFFGWMYSLPPLKLAWRGWGELDNALLGGMVLPLYGYAVHSHQIDGPAVLVFMPFMLLVFLNLLATTWPDRLADEQVGKNTLATRWPMPTLRRVYYSVVLVIVGVLLALTPHVLPFKVFTLSLLVLPLVIVSAVRYTRDDNPTYAVSAMVSLLVIQMFAWKFCV
jgi:1,4-dihydroxy-2-naphthoate polyprenyltransferase